MTTQVVPPVVRISPVIRLKWQLFRVLERLSDLVGNDTAGHFSVTAAAAPVPDPALWVFVSTIGELHAVDPFLRQLIERLRDLKLVLITDHAHYRDSYQALYPDAAVCVSRGHGDDPPALALRYPPRAIVVAEIPLLPFDAPCRFSFGFVLEAKRHQAQAILVNGWLYHYRPSCRMDSIERAFFLRDYLRAFDVLCVQTDASREILMRLGAPPERVAVVGNIKFDSMQRGEWRTCDARSPRLLDALLASGRATVVAGCVTGLVEQQLVLDAFGEVLRHDSNALLVLAPRHPEVTEGMQALCGLLTAAGLVAGFRSRMADTALGDEVNCLVLDTMGDLRDFYAAAAVAHVGVDHNVLEPLGFGKPVTVMPGWEKTYPSYPVYRMLSDAGALLEARDAAQLVRHWLGAIASPGAAARSFAPAQIALEIARGAVARHFAAMEHCLSAASHP